MKRAFAMLATGLMLCASSAFAYNIQHSYSAPGNTTEYHGSCANGGEMMLVEKPGIGFAYQGPAGEGMVNGNLDDAAKKACGE